MDPEPSDRHLAQDVPVQGQPREGNDERREHRRTVEQSRARAPMPPARGRTHENDRCANEGANVDANANADADAPPLFRWASQNLAAATMLMHDCPEAATSKE
jgi:hypothetical protein